jgi:protein HOOK3
MEKYKKKLQESADLRQHARVCIILSLSSLACTQWIQLFQSLEKQNAELVDKNESLEEEYRKIAAFKPLIESYKNQIADLEAKASVRTQENETLKFEIDQTRTKLKIILEERAKDSETIELYQERLRELEFTKPTSKNKVERNRSNEAESAGGELSCEDDSGGGLGSELDNAGFTTTDLKLQVRKLKRELESMRKNETDGSKVLFLENLLDDARRIKTRYEADYLAAHRDNLILQRNLEEIRSGRSLGDG